MNRSFVSRSIVWLGMTVNLSLIPPGLISVKYKQLLQITI